jgi:hypothetical protein
MKTPDRQRGPASREAIPGRARNRRGSVDVIRRFSACSQFQNSTPLTVPIALRGDRFAVITSGDSFAVITIGRLTADYSLPLGDIARHPSAEAGRL